VPTRERLRDRVQKRIAERISHILMPGEVQRQARILAIKRDIQLRRQNTATRPDKDQAGYLSFKQEGSNFTQAARFSRNDVPIAKTMNRILWRRRIKPQVLAGMYDVNTWINAGINQIEKWVNQDGWDIVKDRKGGGTPQDKDQLLDFFEDSNADGDYIEDLVADIVVDSSVLGDHLTELGRNDDEELIDLHTIAGETALIETDLDGNITGYVQRNPRTNKEVGRLEPGDVMQFRRNARGRTLFGSPLIKALLLAFDADMSAQTCNRACHEPPSLELRSLHWRASAQSLSPFSK